MAVGLHVGSTDWPVGTGDFFHAFFSTIAVRLERDGWGSRFPTVMRELYSGRLEGGEPAERAAGELERIRSELAAMPPSDVVWDSRDRSKRPPWGDDISTDITDLSNYFVTDDGRDLFEVLEEAVRCAARSRRPLTVA